MSDFKEQIKTKSDALQNTVKVIMGEENPVNEINAENKAAYDRDFLEREVKEQEKFRKIYKERHKSDNNAQKEAQINAPADYAPEDIVIQKRKYGYFYNTKKARAASARAQKEAWQDSMDAYETNISEDGYAFDVDEKTNEDTLDLMVTTRRFIAAEEKKAGIAAVILTEDAIKALKEKNEIAAGILDDYRTVIMHLGPSLEVEPGDDDNATGEIKFTEESVEAYRAYLKAMVNDPVATIETAVTDTLHSLTSFPDKMLGVSAIPRSFDRLMQIRNRFEAVNKLRRLRQDPKDVKEDNPLGALMTKLYPRVNKAKDKKKNKNNPDEHGEGHAHDEAANFKYINLLETAINSDMVSCLKKAGITYREGLFGKKRTITDQVKNESKYLDSDGNAAKDVVAAVKKGLKNESRVVREEKRKLNSEYWEKRESDAYKRVEGKRRTENREGRGSDSYKITAAVSKIKAKAADKTKVKYNTALAGELEERLGRISSAIDDLKFTADSADEALALDEVKMSKELTARMKAHAARAQYDLFHMLERAAGYLNVYDHIVSGKALSDYGSIVMEEVTLEMKTSKAYNDGTNEWVNVSAGKLDTRYNTDNVERMNRIAQSGENVPAPVVASDRDAVESAKEQLSWIESSCDKLMRKISHITPQNRNEIINDLIKFKDDYKKYLKLAGLTLKHKEGKSAFSALSEAVPEEADRTALFREYSGVMSKANYLCAYADLFRLDNIIGSFTGDDLPEGLVLDEDEKKHGPSYFAKERAKLKQQLDIHLKEAARIDRERMKAANNMNLFDADPEAGEAEAESVLTTLLKKAVLDDISNEKYPAQAQDREQPDNIQINGPVQDKEANPDNDEEHEEEINIVRRKQDLRVYRRNEKKNNDGEGGKEKNNNAGGEEAHEDHHENNANEAPYEIRIKSQAALQIINEGSLRTTREFVDYVRGQLSVLNKIDKVTWEEVKKEASAWMIGKELVKHGTNEKVKITKENAGNLIDELFNTFDKEQVTDASHYTQEENELFADKEEESVYAPGSVQDTVKKAIGYNTEKDLAKFVISKLPENAVNPGVQNSFKKAYLKIFKDSISVKWQGRRKVTVKDLGIPEADQKHVQWFLDNMPENLSTKQELSKYRTLWNRKVGYDLLNGKKLDERTYKKIKGFFDAWESAMVTAGEEAVEKKIRDNLKTVNTSVKIPDMSVGNEETIPNVIQWYGLSCWATSGALIANWYAKNTLKLENPPKFDQMTFLDPTQVVLNPYAEDQLDKEKKGTALAYGFSQEEEDIRGFVQAGGGMGNLWSVPDFMLANLSNTGVRHLRFNIPQNDKHFNGNTIKNDEWKKLSQLFFNRVADMIQSGSGPISMLIPGHYRTIIGFKDGKLRCRDSSSSVCKNGDSEFDISLDKFRDLLKDGFRNGKGYSCDFVYLQKLDGEDKEQLKQKYKYEYDEEGNLQYNEDYEKMRASSPENMAQNLGLVYSNETVNNDNLLDRFLKDEIYVPKNLNHVKNIENVTKKIEETRKKLGLPDITNEQKQNTERIAQAHKQNSDNIRRIKAEEWENRVKFKSEVDEENRLNEQRKRDKAKQDEVNRRRLEDERKRQEEDRKKQEEERKKNAELTRAKDVFGDKFTEQEKDELVKKTKQFDKLLKDNTALSSKEKKVKPTALDVIKTDYESKEKALIERKENEQGPVFGWLLTAEDTKKVDDLIQKGGNAFANKLTESEESKLKDRNDAIKAIKEGDISKYNHLPSVVKEVYGRRSIEAFFAENRMFKKGLFPTLESLSKEEKTRLAGKTRDPIFRGALNMMITRKAKDQKGGDVAKRAKAYDEFLNQQLILQTLAPMEEADERLLREKDVLLKKSRFDGRQTPDEMIRNNKIKQRHLAKTMFLMQLGRFDRTDTNAEGEDTTSMFDSNITEALAHGTRVGISLPAGDKASQDALYNAWQGQAGGLMYSRFATHDFHRRKVNDKKSRFTEIKLKPKFTGFLSYIFKGNKQKKPTSYMDNYGMDLSLGGLGKAFNKDVIDDQGRFGHLYQRMKKGDENTCAGLLVGIENSAPGGTKFIQKKFGGYGGVSSIGELHNSKAIAHGQSAFYSRRAFLGKQHDGRTVDLSHINIKDLTDIINAFETKYSQLQEEASVKIDEKSLAKNQLAGAKKRRDEAKANLEKINTVLSGRILTAQELYELLEILGVKGARHKAQAMRSPEGAAYARDENKYPKKMHEAKVKERVKLDEFYERYKLENDEGIHGDEDDDNED